MKNKVYEPKDTIQDTVLYEGKLKFNQEFSLVFSYKMRSYSNINQKSAFLDLIGNILEVTYRRGIFWQGGRKVIGPPQNTAGWNKVNGYINNAWDQMTSFGEALLRGNIDMGSILASASEMVTKAWSGAKEAIQNVGSMKQNAGALIESTKDFLKKSHFGEALKGQLLNTLGRPAIYAWDAYLSGDDVGLWHVTIGNPFNPIAAFGNLIVTGASLQHLGPLGIDDFPTELKVTVNLKHARSRDLTEIGKMYTKGFSGIYSISGYRLKTLYFNEKNHETGYVKTDNDDKLREIEVNNESRVTDLNKALADREQKFNEETKNLDPSKEADKKKLDDLRSQLINDQNEIREQEQYKLTPPSSQMNFSDVYKASMWAELGTDMIEKHVALSDEIANA